MKRFYTYVTACFVGLVFSLGVPTLSQGKKPVPVKKAKKKATKKVKSKKVKKKASKKAKAPAKRVLSKADKIIEKMLKATGGRKVHKAIKSMYAAGNSQLILPNGARKAKLFQYMLKPHFQRTEQHIGPMVVIMVFYAGGGWMSQNGVVINLPKSMIEVAESEKARMDLELRYIKEGIKLKLKGSKKVRGKDCWELEFEDKKKRKTNYYIDKKKNVLVQRVYVGPSPLGIGNVKFTVHMGDFRWVPVGKKGKGGKVLMPFKTEQWMRGSLMGTVQFKKVELNGKKVKKRLFRKIRPVD